MSLRVKMDDNRRYLLASGEYIYGGLQEFDGLSRVEVMRRLFATPVREGRRRQMLRPGTALNAALRAIGALNVWLLGVILWQRW